jgi:nucleotide-binding universal stress UspA family protein
MNKPMSDHTSDSTPPTVPSPTRRIVVALDASSYSLTALRAAAELATLLDVELEGLFIEDINLLYLCGFPFSQEIGSFTAHARRLEDVVVERQLRTQAAAIHQAMNQIVLRTPVRWTFQVRRGSVVNELLAAAQSADLLSIGRSGQVRRRALGSTARALVQRSQRPVLVLDEAGGIVSPFIAIYTGSETSRRVLEWLSTLAHTSNTAARIFLVVRPNSQNTLEELEQEARTMLGDLPAEFIPLRYGNVLMSLRAHNGGTLVLPSEYADLVAEHSGPTIIVP